MKELVLLLAMIGQDFSMFGSTEVEKPPVPIITTVIKKVEVPVHYMEDISGQEWWDKDKENLKRHIKNENARLRKKRQQQVELSPEIQVYVGKDNRGREWMGYTPEELRNLLLKANSEQTIMAQPWPRQQFISQPQAAAIPSYQMNLNSFSTGASVSSGSSC